MKLNRKLWWMPALGVIIGASIALGRWWAKPTAVVEPAAPAVQQTDGSRVLARAPNATAKAKHQTPPDSKLERVVAVTVQPDAQPAASGKPCPPLEVDLSLVRLPDDTRRVVASSPDGQVVGGVDIPVAAAALPPEPPAWAAGLSMNPTHQTLGVWLERDLSRFRVGVELNQARRAVDSPLNVEARVRIGWRF